MGTGGTGLANAFKNALHQLELIRHKGVNGGEIVFVGERFVCAPGVGEAELVAQDVSLLAVDLAQGILGLWFFVEQATLDDFIDVAAGQRQAGFEATLNLGEVVSLGGAYFTQHSVDVLLRGNQNPGATTTDRTEVFGDGLQAEH